MGELLRKEVGYILAYTGPEKSGSLPLCERRQAASSPQLKQGVSADEYDDVVESFLLTADISLQGVHKVITDEFETRIEIAASADDFRKATLKKRRPRPLWTRALSKDTGI